MSLLSSRHNLQRWISVSGAWGIGVDSVVTVSGVQLLTTQKPVKRPAWWKGKFALFWMLATRRKGRLLSKTQLLPTEN